MPDKSEAPLALKVRFVLDADCPGCEQPLGSFLSDGEKLPTGDFCCGNCGKWCYIDPFDAGNAKMYLTVPRIKTRGKSQ